MQKNTLNPTTALKRKKLVGRGGKRGKTAGRGTKGQSARAGNKKRPELRDIIKKLPKLRGYKFKSVDYKMTTVTLNQIDKVIKEGEKITPNTLVTRGVISDVSGKVPHVKILATGKITKAATFSKFSVSEGARKAINDAGGTVK